MDLLSLPIAVFCGVVCCRLTLKELVRLDAAFCCQQRENWIQLLRSFQFSFDAPVEISGNYKMGWLLNRNVTVSDVKFVRELNRTDVSGISKYLRTYGSSVRSVHFNGGDQVEINLVAIFCRALTRLCITAASLTSEFSNVLHCNPNIQHLVVENVRCKEPNLMEGLSFHTLQSLCMVGVVAGDYKGCLWHESTHGNCIHTVIWDNCVFREKDFRALLTNCPQLRSFSCNGCPLGELCLLDNYVHLMTRLINFSASDDDSLTDATLLTLARNLTSLRTLNIRGCNFLTDQSLLHIAEHSRTTLEVLYADIKNPESKETGQVLETFSQKCTKLTLLNVNCRDKLLCTGRGTSMLVRGCPALRTLVVNRRETICESSREFIAVMRPKLTLLVHDNSTVYDILSMPI
mgnify:CR=1 FL=1